MEIQLSNNRVREQHLCITSHKDLTAQVVSLRGTGGSVNEAVMLEHHTQQ